MVKRYLDEAPSSTKREVISLDDDDIANQTQRLAICDDEEIEVVPDFEFIDLSSDDDDTWDFLRELTPVTEQDAYGLPFGHVIVNIAEALGAQLEPGSDVELSNGELLRIAHMSRDVATGQVDLSGFRMVRLSQLNGMLPKTCNELCMILKASIDGHRNSPNACLVTRPLSMVVAIRKIIITNRPFPQLSFREGSIVYTEWKDVRETAVLVCRWKHTEFYDPVDGKVKEESLERLMSHETDFGKGMPDVQLRRQWREHGQEEDDVTKPLRPTAPENLVDLTAGDHNSGTQKRSRVDVDLTLEDGDHRGKLNQGKVERVDLTGDADDVEEEIWETETIHTYKRTDGQGVTELRSSNTKVIKERFIPKQTTLQSAFAPQKANVVRDLVNEKAKPLRQYTSGDLCAGAGGMASGAEQAGLKLEFALDHWDDAANTLRKNFAATGTRIMHMDIYDFCTGKALFRKYYRIDILHISFPCQPHSLVHTVDGKNDEENVATGYSAIPILKLLRPRVVTLEQTPGIIHRGGYHFRALIHQIASLGYSVRWKILNAADYGNAQARKRLIIIASCPGEPLPPFPKPTHGTGPGLKPYTTIADALAKMPRFVEPHMQNFTVKNGTPYSANQPLKGCITTNGGESDLHPSGKRSFTLQELALLQGFRPEHRFAPGGLGTIRKQIGNAVPSCMAKAVFDEVVKTLRKSDEMTAKWKPEVISVD